MLAPLLCLTLLLQGEAPTPQGGSGGKAEAPAAQPSVEEIDDKRARAVLKDYKTATPRKAKLAQRLRATQELAKYKHKSLVKTLAKIVQTEKAVSVAKIAAEALGNQPPKQAKKVIVRLMSHEKIKKNFPLVAALIGSLSRCGYDSRRDWKEIDDLFERRFESEYVQVQKAILKLIAAHKEKQGIRLLLDHLDEPRPVNVDDPSNPPASYWEARWKAWRAWRADVKEALYQITGQRFSTSAEARTWLDKNGREIGIK